MLEDSLFDYAVVTFQLVLDSIVDGSCPTVVQHAAYMLRELYHADRIDARDVMTIWTSRN